MFYDVINDNVIDFVGGRKDIERGIIRAIGNPLERLKEDYLRVMRAVRFSHRFGFRIDTATKRAAKASRKYQDGRI